MSDKEEPPGAGEGSSGTGGRFHFLQPSRDLQSNWEVDLAKNLEEYLLKICSGEVSSEQSVNFAEAALLLQGSVQVYSRKVEYLYSLVLHVLDFLSQKRQDQQEKDCTKPDDSGPSATIHEEDELFLGLDDVLVKAKNRLNDALDKYENSNHFVKAPTNLLVLEGDCLDTNGDANEFESYLLATCDFYGDILLLDPCDAGGIDSYSQSNAFNKEQASTHIVTSARPKAHENAFQTPRRAGGSCNASLRKDLNDNVNKTSEDNIAFELYNENFCSEPHADQNNPDEDMDTVEEPNFGCADVQDDSDEDEDPWKPLNHHEPGNLKIKPFRKGSILERKINHNSRRKTTQFPLAKMDSTIGREFAEFFEVKIHLKETQKASPALYEKLRASLSFGSHGSLDFSDGLGDKDHDAGDENDLPDFEHAEYDMGMEESSYEKERDDAIRTFGTEPSSLDDLDFNTNLEDLCQSHLDALLASLAETEKLTDLAARVSTWKQRIEQTLEEQDKHPAFDIHQYGERILDKLSLEADDNGSMTFTDVVFGQPKQEVARTFSALLQLVNNGNVDLQRASGDLVCHTIKKPFWVKLLDNQRRKVQVNIPSAKRRRPSPLSKCSEATLPLKSPPKNGKLAVKPKKGGPVRRTPDGKRRRRSGLAEDLHLAADM